MNTDRVWSTPLHERVVQLVRSRTGLTVSPEMRTTVEARIQEAMAARSVKDLSEYVSALSSGRDALDDLIDRLTIGETYFFREPAQLEYIRTKVLPELERSAAGHPIRVWSAGCSSGEEAYSLAILLRESGWEGRAAVLGTDISKPCLALARRGRFSEWSLRAVPGDIVRRYFRRVGKEYRLGRNVREAVTFRRLNLVGGEYPAAGVAGMDLILCRNVLIYLSGEAVATVAQRLLDALAPGGWLFLGASDPPLAELTECEVVVTGAGVAYRRRSGAEGGSSRGRRTVGAVWSEEAAPVAAALPVAATPVLRTEREPDPTVQQEFAVESLFAARDYAGAAELALRAIGAGADAPRLWEVRIRALAKLGSLEQAERACGSAIDRHRTSAELMCLQAVVLAAAGRSDEAIGAARRALYLDRTLAMAHLVLGNALLQAGDPSGARRSLETAETLLQTLAPDALVPASDGEPAARLVGLVRRQLDLVAA